jgi:hypothetical protein
MEKRNEIWHVECEKPVDVRVTTVATELARHKLDIVGVQEVRWDKWGTARPGDYTFFHGKETKIFNWEQNFLYTA